MKNKYNNWNWFMGYFVVEKHDIEVYDRVRNRNVICIICSKYICHCSIKEHLVELHSITNFKNILNTLYIEI